MIKPVLPSIGQGAGQLQEGLIRKTIYEIMETRPEHRELLQAVVDGLDQHFRLTYALYGLQDPLVADPHDVIPHRTLPDLKAAAIAEKEARKAGGPSFAERLGANKER